MCYFLIPKVASAGCNSIWNRSCVIFSCMSVVCMA
uniref:Uncharacterized protein n=1 Tax=Arundo donax TaxID=35708 RepID=A0A0A9BU47_ARUDO